MWNLWDGAPEVRENKVVQFKDLIPKIQQGRVSGSASIIHVAFTTDFYSYIPKEHMLIASCSKLTLQPLLLRDDTCCVGPGDVHFASLPVDLFSAFVCSTLRM